MSSSSATLEQKLNYLLGSTHAYDDIPANGNGKKGKKQIVKSMVQHWAKLQQDKVTVQVPGTWSGYHQRAKGGAQKEAYHEDAKKNLNPSTFKFLPTDSVRHLEIVDQQGDIIAYCLRLPSHFTETLTASAQKLPSWKTTNHQRGTTANQHWTLWVPKGATHPALSAQYRDALPYSATWFNDNRALFIYLSKTVLRNLNPKMYAKFLDVRRYLPEDLQPLCEAWHGCAINRYQIKDGEPHIDSQDYKFGYNVVTGWGEFTTSKLLIWQLQLAIEIVPGDAVLFLGQNFTHNTVDIQGGERNIIDAFAHLKVMSWPTQRNVQLTSAKGKEKMTDEMDVDYDPLQPDTSTSVEEEMADLQIMTD
ncbi:MAG: hypothetical protein M4579_007495, partial [Chaenotheca gracillima]